MPSKNKKQNGNSNHQASDLEDRDELCRKIDEIFLHYIQTFNELSNSYALLTEKMKDVSSIDLFLFLLILIAILVGILQYWKV